MTRLRPINWAMRAAMRQLSGRARLRVALRRLLAASPTLSRLAGKLLAGAQADMIAATRASPVATGMRAAAPGFDNRERLHRTARAIIARAGRP